MTSDLSSLTELLLETISLFQSCFSLLISPGSRSRLYTCLISLSSRTIRTKFVSLQSSSSAWKQAYSLALRHRFDEHGKCYRSISFSRLLQLKVNGSELPVARLNRQSLLTMKEPRGWNQKKNSIPTASRLIPSMKPPISPSHSRKLQTILSIFVMCGLIWYLILRIRSSWTTLVTSLTTVKYIWLI